MLIFSQNYDLQANVPHKIRPGREEHHTNVALHRGCMLHERRADESFPQVLLPGPLLTMHGGHMLVHPVPAPEIRVAQSALALCGTYWQDVLVQKRSTLCGRHTVFHTVVGDCMDGHLASNSCCLQSSLFHGEPAWLLALRWGFCFWLRTLDEKIWAALLLEGNKLVLVLQAHVGQSVGLLGKLGCAQRAGETSSHDLQVLHFKPGAQLFATVT
mmetsp:Transcript_2918/g.6882  ORF Transcript_2918/g.6882 Transcript_2918/m.6882 type:complete len:214 (+) Transcript_2918:420-1061(+)